MTAMLIAAPLDEALPTPDPRALEILLRARNAFVDKGFDGASMQDLARAAGMSVGNFYRYFPSKAALVAALITADLAEMDRDFALIIGSGEPMAALRQTIRTRVAGENCNDDGLLWAEITAAALRNPEIAAITRHMEQRITGYLCAVFARVTGLPVATVEALHASRARFLVALVKTAGMLPLADPTTPDVRTHILTAIDRTLSEIANLPKD
jgi:AcrR family transcriptional regulator